MTRTSRSRNGIGVRSTTPVEAAAIAWWEMRRPVEWTLEQHLENPTINTTTEAERNLATAVAGLVSVS